MPEVLARLKWETGSFLGGLDIRKECKKGGSLDGFEEFKVRWSFLVDLFLVFVLLCSALLRFEKN